MIKKLFNLILELIKDIITFNYDFIKYDVKNLYWYLIYEFTYSDIQDMDAYITHKYKTMLPKFIKYGIGRPTNVDEIQYDKDLKELLDLSKFLFSENYYKSGMSTQIIKQNRFRNLLHKYYFDFWF